MLLQTFACKRNLKTEHISNFFYCSISFFFKENVRNPVWICRDPISLILGTRLFRILGTRWWFSLILGTRFENLGTRIGSLKRLIKYAVVLFVTQHESENTKHQGLTFVCCLLALCSFQYGCNYYPQKQS